MGEVYRARDAKLGRDVALKVLPHFFSADPDRVARFEREARLLAALNHPHIATIHGLEESGGTRFLVLELVEGGTLADRLARGRDAGTIAREVNRGSRPAARRRGPSPAAIPAPEALAIAHQIADALQAAHEKGIVHRDLKPANIAFTSEGQVKVLDFGLAKFAEGTGPGLSSGPAASPGRDLAYAVSMSPTITNPAALTGVGMLLGTAAYMSPEQAKGREADKRSDVWAFGCVLYEMLTGRRTFEGGDAADTLAFVLSREPDWTALPPNVPSSIRALLKRCLEKDRRTRVADIAAATFVLDEAASRVQVDEGGGPAEAGHYGDVGPYDGREGAAEAGLHARARRGQRTRRRDALLVAASLAVGAAATGGSVWFATRPVPAPSRVERYTIAPSGSAALSIDGSDRDLVITHDGTRVVYVGNTGTQLFVRALDQLDPVAIASGAGLRGTFAAPDGQWVGFVENTTVLKKVAITGGPAISITRMDGASRGATWAPDDTIVFATIVPTTGLQQVPAGGGPVTVLTRPDRARGEADHLWPEAIAGSRAILFTITAQSGLDAAQVAVLDRITGNQKILVRGGSDAHYVPTGTGSPARAGRESGHLVYTAGGTLRAVAFDLERLETRGTPVPVLSQLATTPFGAGDFSVASDGTLAYADTPGGGRRTLVWVDRQGREEPLPAPPRAYEYPQLSPDGTRVAVYISDQNFDIWVWDLTRSNLTRLTTDPNIDQFPVWTHDGRRILFGSPRAGAFNLYWQAADGTGVVERLLESNATQQPTGASPDGRHIVFYQTEPGSGRDLMMLTLDRSPGRDAPAPGSGPARGARGVVTPLLQTGFEERNAVVSPDGRWLAYEADRSGRLEIYVQPFPDVEGGQWQVSTEGGTRPVWARSGRELFYRAPNGAVMAVGVEVRGAAFSSGPPARVVDGPYYLGGSSAFARTYDVSPDGQRFLMIKQAGDRAPPQIVVVKHWFEELRRLSPAD